MSKKIDDIADIIAELYFCDRVIKFVPGVGKSGDSPWCGIKNKWKPVTGHIALDILLRNTILSKIRPKIIKTENGIKREELQKGIEILRNEINELIVTDSNPELLSKYQNYLLILESLLVDCLEIGNFETSIDYCETAKNAIQIFQHYSVHAEELYNKINAKLGITVKEAQSGFEYANDKWATYREFDKSVLTEEENKKYQIYLRRNNMQDGQTSYVPSYERK